MRGERGGKPWAFGARWRGWPQVTNRLLMAAVADPSQTVRMTVLTVLNQTEALDEYLAQVGKGIITLSFPCQP